MIRQNLPRDLGIGCHVDHTLPPGTLEVWQEGKCLGRIENIGREGVTPPPSEQEAMGELTQCRVLLDSYGFRQAGIHNGITAMQNRILNLESMLKSYE